MGKGGRRGESEGRDWEGFNWVDRFHIETMHTCSCTYMTILGYDQHTHHNNITDNMLMSCVVVHVCVCVEGFMV